jgi:hypothetical protein
MRLLIAVFVLAVSAAAFADYGIELWDGRFGHHDPALRPINYDSQYEMTGQRRIKTERIPHGGPSP